MTNRKAPFSHADGSNCWTKDCSRRGGANTDEQRHPTPVSALATLEKASLKASFDLMQSEKEEKEKALAAQNEEMRLKRKAEMEDMLPILKDISDWQDEWEDEEDWEDELDSRISDEIERLNAEPVKKFPISHQGAGELYNSLVEAERIAFENLSPDSSFRRKYQGNIAGGALTCLNDSDYGVIVHARSEHLNERVNECIEILNDVRDYSEGRRSRFEEYRLGRRINALNAATHYIFGTPVSIEDRRDAYKPRFEPKSMLVNKEIAHPAFHAAFGVSGTQKKAITSNVQNDAVWIHFEFPEVSSEYNKTEELLKTASTMKQGIEDEYFVEQVSANYYPSIHRSLEAVSGKDVSPKHRTLAIEETKSQLQLIQGGLQQIIDRSVSRELQETKAQTAFLRAKMSGNAPDLGLPVQLKRPTQGYPKGYSA